MIMSFDSPSPLTAHDNKYTSDYQSLSTTHGPGTWGVLNVRWRIKERKELGGWIGKGQVLHLKTRVNKKQHVKRREKRKKKRICRRWGVPCGRCLLWVDGKTSREKYPASKRKGKYYDSDVRLVANSFVVWVFLQIKIRRAKYGRTDALMHPAHQQRRRLATKYRSTKRALPFPWVVGGEGGYILQVLSRAHRTFLKKSSA